MHCFRVKNYWSLKKRDVRQFPMNNNKGPRDGGNYFFPTFSNLLKKHCSNKYEVSYGFHTQLPSCASLSTIWFSKYKCFIKMETLSDLIAERARRKTVITSNIIWVLLNLKNCLTVQISEENMDQSLYRVNLLIIVILMLICLHFFYRTFIGLTINVISWFFQKLMHNISLSNIHKGFICNFQLKLLQDLRAHCCCSGSFGLSFSQ